MNAPFPLPAIARGALQLGQDRPDHRELVADWARMRPHGGFGLIVADPPWSQEMRTPNGYAKSPQAQYRCQSLRWIQTLPVESLAGRDCWLWLWTLGNMVPHAMGVLEAWGFEFCTTGYWAKTTRAGEAALGTLAACPEDRPDPAALARHAGKHPLQFGTGFVLRGAGEPFLIAKRGEPKVRCQSVRSVILAPRGIHSEKPDAAFEAAAALAGDVARLELFSRRRRAGWTVWGDEVEG